MPPARAALSFLLFALLLAVGCNSLPARKVMARDEEDDRPAVVLLRGWRGLWSEGVDALGKKLADRGVPAQVYRHDQWRDVGRAMLASAQQDEDRLVIVGFSYGADDAIQLARLLRERERRVDLLVLIDPVTPAKIPPNVQTCLSYYQSNGVMDVFPWLRGVPVQAEQATQDVVNADLRKHRTDLLQKNTSHSTIAGNPKLHDEIIRRVLDVYRPVATLHRDDQ